MTINLEEPNRGAVALARIRHKHSGKVFVVVRDDRATTGLVWYAVPDKLTETFSINTSLLSQKFEPYVEPKRTETRTVNRVVQAVDVPLFDMPVTAQTTSEETVTVKRGRGRPKGSKNKTTKPKTKRAAKKESE